MDHHLGIWIDHRRAVIVALNSDDATVKTVESHVEKHLERSGDSPLRGRYEARQVPADDSRQRALTGELSHYYDAVLAALPRHANLVIFGPGEAKREFHKHVLHEATGIVIDAVETNDKMTEPQIVAKVREHFKTAAPRRN